MSKCVTMYEENKPSTLINDVQEWPNFFCAILVRSAMPNTSKYIFIHYDMILIPSLVSISAEIFPGPVIPRASHS